jgi:hypothetical protein
MRAAFWFMAIFLTVVVLPGLASPVFYDDFDDNTRSTYWISFADPNVTIAEANHRLEITFFVGASGNQFGAGYQSKWALKGNFDAQVDYELIDWPAGNGVRVGLVPTWWSIERDSWGPEGQTPAEGYCMNSYFGHQGIIYTSDVSGSLRVVRSGSLVTSYCKRGDGSWQTIHSFDYGANGAIDVPWFSICAWTHDYAFADKEVKFAFDNFSVNSGEIVPPIPAVPEPSNLLVLLGGIGGIGGVIWRRNK